MKNWLTKKNMLVFALVSFLLAQLVPYVIQSSTCSSGVYHKWWWQPCMTIEDALFPLYILALPLTALYFLRDEIFRSWVRFILIWAPLSVILTMLSHPYDNFPFPASGGISIILGWIMVTMSLAIFALKSWELHRVDQGNPLAWWVKWAGLVAAFILSVVLSVYTYGLIW